MPGDYEVGYGRPPKHSRFKPGQSGNPGGRPKSEKANSVDIAELIDTPIEVTAGGRTRAMLPFEIGLRKLAKRALEKDLRAGIMFLQLCEEYGVLKRPSVATGGGEIRVVKSIDPDGLR